MDCANLGVGAATALGGTIVWTLLAAAASHIAGCPPHKKLLGRQPVGEMLGLTFPSKQFDCLSSDAKLGRC